MCFLEIHLQRLQLCLWVNWNINIPPYKNRRYTKLTIEGYALGYE